MWAEPCLIGAAKEEYDGVIEEFLATGEKLFGPYVWGRCVLPAGHALPPVCPLSPGVLLSPAPEGKGSARPHALLRGRGP